MLPDDRLLCHNGRDILLFDLRDAPETDLLATQRNQPPGQVALAQLRLYPDAISQPYLVHDSVRVTVLTDEGVKSLIIPRSGSVPQTMDCVDLLSESIFNSGTHVGYDRAVICRFPVMSMLQYAWPEDHSSLVLPQKSTIQTQYWSDILFDESSSRIVIGGGVSMIEAILDLATAA